MTISPEVGVLIMMNNYFHDVATALLFSSGIAMWVIYKKFGGSDSQEVRDYFLRLYKSISLLVRFSLAWIILGGIPRVIFYKEFEWANAAGKGQVPALIVKHILFVIFISAGAYVWFKIKMKADSIKAGMKGDLV